MKDLESCLAPVPTGGVAAFPDFRRKPADNQLVLDIINGLAPRWSREGPGNVR